MPAKVRHSEWNRVMPHVVVCGKTRSTVEAMPMGRFVHLLVYATADLCPECVDGIEAVISLWREATGHRINHILCPEDDD